MIKRVVFASVVGSIVERYDVYLYALVTGLVFDKLYFPSSDPFISVLLAYISFAMAYVARPLGGIIFGHFGDRIGRKKMLIMSLMLSGTATTAIAFLPAYSSIGIMAPIILCILRFLQGIGLGGEWGGAVLMTYEFAPSNLRGFYGSLPQTGLPIGMILASGTIAFLSNALTPEQFLAWGWRISFAVSAVLMAIGIWIRVGLFETPDFRQATTRREIVKIPFKEMITKNTHRVLLGIGARFVEGVLFGLYGVWLISYLTKTIHISRFDVALAITISAAVMSVAVPFFGWLSDKLGRSKVYCWGSLLSGVAVFPALWLIDHSNGNAFVALAAMVVPFGIFYSSVYGTEAALFCDLFPTNVRYTGISFIYQLASLFTTGIFPIIAVLLLGEFGNTFAIGVYVFTCGLVSAFSAAAIGRLKREDTQ